MYNESGSRVLCLAGGEGAPELTETLKNLGINGVAVAALGWLVRWDLAASDRDKVLVQREEGLARLQVGSQEAEQPKSGSFQI